MIKTFLLLFVLQTLIFAAPAFPGKRQFTQADGTTFTAQGHGDEYLNWIEAEDGSILRYNTHTKNYEYADIKDGALGASGIVYSKTKRENRPEKTQIIPSIKKEVLLKLWQERRTERHSKSKKHSHQ